MAGDVLQRIKVDVAKALQDRCITSGAADSEDSQLKPGEIHDHVIDLIETWFGLTELEEGKLQYWGDEEKGSGPGLLHTPLDEDERYARGGFNKFTTNWSLRDVEPTVPIRLRNFNQDLSSDDE